MSIRILNADRPNDANHCPYCMYRHPVSSIVTDHIKKEHPDEA